MKSVLDDLGEQCWIDISKLMNEYVDRIIGGARTSQDDEDFATYRQNLSNEYMDLIYYHIRKSKKEKKRGNN